MCRPSHNIWWYLFGFRKYRNIISFFQGRLYRGYFWEDSFGQYINRWFLCPILGHRNIQYFKDGEGCSNEKAHWYCFNCHRCIPYEETK